MYKLCGHFHIWMTESDSQWNRYDYHIIIVKHFVSFALSSTTIYNVTKTFVYTARRKHNENTNLRLFGAAS